MADRLHRGESGLRLTRSPPQRSAGLPEEQHARRLVHHPPVHRLNWGIPLPFDPELRHLRLVRCAGELHQHPGGARRSGRARRLLRLINRQQSTSTRPVAGRYSCHRQRHPEISRRLLADHAQGHGRAVAEAIARARLVAKGRRRKSARAPATSSIPSRSSTNGAWMHSAFTSCANWTLDRTAIGPMPVSKPVTMPNWRTAWAIS